ncbi:transcriptional repressor scratch 1 [Elysia marginata]|uniref:Transcriptional repressor scratch 1 n=1 Tax=Elysia marginata TaxID=1093978 RepID=A0AAV4GBB6_9GAST|nr:transcriptional repressor scratch 1 [Elysia marginata]
MPKSFIYSVRNYGSRKTSNDYGSQEISGVKTKMVTRSLFKPGQDTYECLSPWHHGITKRHSYSIREKKPSGGAKSYHHLSLVTRFYLGLRMTQMRASLVSKTRWTGDQSEVMLKTPCKTAIGVEGRSDHKSVLTAGDVSNHPRPDVTFTWGGHEKMPDKPIARCSLPGNMDSERVNVLDQDMRVWLSDKTGNLAGLKEGKDNKDEKKALSQYCLTEPQSTLYSRDEELRKDLMFRSKEKTQPSCHSGVESKPAVAIGKHDRSSPPHNKEYNAKEMDLGVSLQKHKFEYPTDKMAVVSHSNKRISGIGPVNGISTVIGLTTTQSSQSHSCDTDNFFQDDPMTKTRTPIASIKSIQDNSELFTLKTDNTAHARENGLNFDMPRYYSRAGPDNMTRAVTAANLGKGTRAANIGIEVLGGNHHRPIEDVSFHYMDKTSPKKIKNNIKGIPSVNHAPTGKNLMPVTNITLRPQTVSSSTIESVMQRSDMYGGKNKAALSNFPRKIEKSNVTTDSLQEKLNSSLTSGNFVLLRKEPSVSNQFNVYSPYSCGTDESSLNKNQLRVATLGGNIPVFLTACDSLNQDKVSGKVKQLSQSPTIGFPRTERRQDISSLMRKCGDKFSNKEVPKRQVLIEQAQQSLCSQRLYVDDEKEDLFPPLKYQKEHQLNSGLCKSEQEDNSAFKHPTNSGSSSMGLSLFQRHVIDPVLDKNPLFQHSNKINNILTQNADGHKRQKVHPSLFNPVQASAGGAPVFLSPSTSFSKPSTAPSTSRGRHSLPGSCGDEASPLYMPDDAHFYEHSTAHTSINNTVTQQIPQVFLQQHTHRKGESILQRPDEIEYVSVPHSPRSNACNPSISTTPSTSTVTLSFNMPNQIEPSSTLILLKEQQEFATPAFDLLSSVARSPAASCPKVFRIEGVPAQSVSHETNFNTLASYYSTSHQTQVSTHDIQLKAISDPIVYASSETFGKDCVTYKDHGYDMLSSKRPKRPKRGLHESAKNDWPLGPNACNPTYNTDFETMNYLYRENLSAQSCSDKYDAMRSFVATSPGINGIMQNWNVFDASHKLVKNSQNISDESTKPTQISVNFEPVNFVDNTALLSYRADTPARELSTSDGGISSIRLQGIPTTTSATSTSKNHGNNTKGTTSTKAARVDNMCPICCRLFTRSWLLKGHMRTHTGERPYQCSYPTCQKAFADRSNLRSHMLTHTAAPKSFPCRRCGRTFSQKRYLHKHAMEVCKVNLDS